MTDTASHPKWAELTAQQLVRYEALFRLLDAIQETEDLTGLAALVAIQWKYFANVTSWRLVLPYGDGFEVVDGFRGEARLSHAQVLMPWDQYHLDLQRPRLVQVPVPQEGPALLEHLAGKNTAEVIVMPIVRMDCCIALLSAAGSHGPFSELDKKFIRLFGDHFADRVHGILLRRQARETLIAEATHDLLTGLANRALFTQTLQHMLELARRNGSSFAVLALDLDHFKDINDTLGHPVGDLLLHAVAERLQMVSRESDLVARFGGDEFALIVTDIRDPADAAVLANKVLQTLHNPFHLQGNVINSGTSIGIAVYGLDSADAETLLSQADIALYRAKAEQRGTYRFFTEKMDAEVRDRVALEASLREAISAGQLCLAWQPQVAIDTRRLVGVEALLRWRHPERGLLLPDEFIPVAEQSGLIAAVGQWVLRAACRQMKAWLDAGIAPPLLAVNISGIELKRLPELEHDIAAILEETGVPATRLELELSENVLMAAVHKDSAELARLRSTGLRIALRDFGTGFSSLSFLARGPIDRIKIAAVFINDPGNSSRNAEIVKAAISLATALGLTVLAEGVESAEQVALLGDWGCQQVQGACFAKPLTPEELLPHLQRGSM
jgi:diguanylate cyclase (GGDEF)-like protein